MPPAASQRLTNTLAKTWQMGRTGQSVEALSRAKRVFMRAQAANDIQAIAGSLTQIAWFCLQLGQAEQGLDCAIAAKRLWARCEQQREQAHAGAIFGWLLLEIGLSDEAFEEAEQAVALAEGCDDPGVLAFALNVKACVLMYCQQADLAEALLKRSLELARASDDASGVALYLVDLAFAQVARAEDLERTGDMDAARHWRDMCLETNSAAIAAAEECGDRWNLRTALCNGAEYYGVLGQFDSAWPLLARWKKVRGKVGLRERVHYLYTRGELLTRTGSLPEALEVCAEAVALSEASTHNDHQVNALRRLGEVHEAMGNFEAALALHKRFHKLYETQMGEATRRRAHIAEMRLEFGRLRATAERLADEAARDGLTGLPNRRSFDRALAGLEGSAFAFAIIDLDFFKSVNDRYSHAVGDAVLRRAADLLAARNSAGQQVYRLGGEEFAVLFAGTELMAAAACCETLRRALAAHSWSDLALGLEVTASVGLAAGSGHESGLELFAVADRRLYAAKMAGRNQVVCSDPPVQHYFATG